MLDVVIYDVLFIIHNIIRAFSIYVKITNCALDLIKNIVWNVKKCLTLHRLGTNDNLNGTYVFSK